jgi:hypothetical protein
VRPGGIKQNKPRCYKLEAAWCLLVGTAGCQQEPQMDACASSGYDQGVCADEQSRRAAAAAFLGGYMQQRPASFQPAPIKRRSINCRKFLCHARRNVIPLQTIPAAFRQHASRRPASRDRVGQVLRTHGCAKIKIRVDCNRRLLRA